MNAVIFAFTQRGRALARRIRDAVAADGGDVVIRVPENLADDACRGYAGGLSECVGGAFDRDALVFVGAAGIAVRAIAAHVQSKLSDPAVVCVDERAQFVIPILSGHVGGANRLARRLAEALHATPVITTATDLNHRFSVDAWAAAHGLHISSMALAKRVSAEILTRDIPFYSDNADVRMPVSGGLFRAQSGALGVCVSVRDLRPFDDTLLLVPKALRLGIGCRRGASERAIGALIEEVLSEHRLRVEAVAEAASIDVKSNEAGLLACCRNRGWQVAFYSSEALERVPGRFSGSGFVRSVVGVDNVCERAALASGGRLIVPKTAGDGVTVAVAELEWGI